MSRKNSFSSTGSSRYSGYSGYSGSSGSSRSQQELCKTVSEMFHHASQSNKSWRKKPCINGANCKYINPLTGEDTCIFANSIDKLIPEICAFDEKCHRDSCKRFHPARGQTKQEYADLNAFVFPELVKRVLSPESPPEIVQSMSISSLDLNQAFVISNREEEEEDEIQTIVPAPTPVLTYTNVVDTSKMEEISVNQIENEIEDVLDQIEFDENCQEFLEEQERLESDPEFEDYIHFMENLVEIKNQALKYGMSVVF